MSSVSHRVCVCVKGACVYITRKCECASKIRPLANATFERAGACTRVHYASGEALVYIYDTVRCNVTTGAVHPLKAALQFQQLPNGGCYDFQTAR